MSNDIIEKENSAGVMKQYIKVQIGTSIIEVPRYILNPLNNNREDLKNLSDNGYIKPFLALHYHTRSNDLINLKQSPYLSFDKNEWLLTQSENHYIIKKKNPESKFDEIILD